MEKIFKQSSAISIIQHSRRELIQKIYYFNHSAAAAAASTTTRCQQQQYPTEKTLLSTRPSGVIRSASTRAGNNNSDSFGRFGPAFEQPQARRHHSSSICFGGQGGQSGRPKSLLLQNGSLKTHQHQSKRSLFTGTEAVSALRPFYFAVHPDLFVQHPEIQSVNERSLKLLHEHLNGRCVENSGQSLQSSSLLSLTFYLRSVAVDNNGGPQRRRRDVREQDDDDGGQDAEFRRVNLRLGLEKDTLSIVRNILRECSLKDDHLPARGNVTRQKIHPKVGFVPEDWTSYDDEQLEIFWKRRAGRKRPSSGQQEEETTESSGLKKWINKLTKESEAKRESYCVIAHEVANNVEEIKALTGLKSIEWDAHWGLAHCRGALSSFKRSLHIYGSLTAPEAPPFPLRYLNDRQIRFGSIGTFCGVDGALNLSVEDVPEEWLKLISFWSTSTIRRDFETELDQEMKNLSSLLGDAKICWSREARALAFLGWLRQLSQRLSSDPDFKLDLLLDKETNVYVQSPSEALLLTKNGDIHIPVNSLPSSILSFLRNNVPIAKSIRLQHQKKNELLNVAREECKKLLGLISLSWDNNLKMDEIIGCIDRLEEGFGSKATNQCFRGLGIHLSRSGHYQVRDDGSIQIPSDWLP